MEAVSRPATDQLSRLRAFGKQAPWSLRELSAVATELLEAAGVSPINSAASSRPSERTIRFYVTRGLVAAPEGRGTAAIYHYRHLLQVLVIKLRQMEGATLTRLAGELADMTGDVIERKVAAALGDSIPEANPMNRQHVSKAPAVRELPGMGLRRIPLLPGAELLLDERHSALADPGAAAELAERAARVIERLAGELDAPAIPPTSRGARTDG